MASTVNNISRCIFIIIFWTIFYSIFVLPIILVILFKYPYSPSISVDLFNNQALINITKPADSANTNFTIPFHLKLKNRNKAIGLHYPDQINITFSYFPNVSFLVVLAEYKLDSFYQGNGKTKHVRDMVEANGFPRVLEGTDMIALRVDLVGSFRYKKFRTKRHLMELGCVVWVDATSSNKMRMGLIELVEPGLDSKVEESIPPPPYEVGRP